jgi:tRNA(Ile)-lysidine synthetase-like protein
MNMTPVDPGLYVVAVSGGIDSVVLLHILKSQPGLELVVAHYDHGIRKDSAEDRQLVERLAHGYELAFIYEEGNLGSAASEEQARNARYDFLRRARAARGARAIITAHHHDDVLETAVHNISRGTGLTGLASLNSTADIVRPLTHATKQQIKNYALEHNLEWREDNTNANDSFRRNYIRHKILPRFTLEDKRQLSERIQAGRELNTQINVIITDFLSTNTQDGALRRHPFIMLDHASAREVMAAWLRLHDIRDFDKKTIERLTHAAKTYQAGKRADVNGTWFIDVKKQYLALASQER